MVASSYLSMTLVTAPYSSWEIVGILDVDAFALINMKRTKEENP